MNTTARPSPSLVEATAAPAVLAPSPPPASAGEQPSGNPLEEYKEVAANMRLYANLRFAQLTLFSGATAGLISLVAHHSGAWAHRDAVAAGLSGLLITVAFLVMEERAADHWHDFARRAVHLEDTQLSFAVYRGVRRRRWQPRWFTATWATRSLFAGSAAYWIVWLVS